MSRSLPSSRFYGREAELSLLHRFQSDVRDKGISRFVVVTGRRRVGKTRLLEEALPSEASMPTIPGYIASQLSDQNLSNFVKEIERVLPFAALRRLWLLSFAKHRIVRSLSSSMSFKTSKRSTRQSLTPCKDSGTGTI